MAKRGRLAGAINSRSQVWNPKIEKWVKRGEDGRFQSVKHDGEPYKNVRKET
jgi:hypothetical protein